MAWSLWHLARVDFLNAAALILPAAEYAEGGAEATDPRVIKTLLSISRSAVPDDSGNPRALPLLVAEIFDRQKVAAAGKAYNGPAEIIASDALIGSLIAQTMRHNISLTPPAERRRDLYRLGVALERVSLDCVEADYNSPSDMSHVNPSNFDNVVILGSNRMESSEEADARTIAGHLLVRDHLDRNDAGRPHIMVELMDSGNRMLIGPGDDDVLLSPVLVSHMLAQVALRPELHSGYEELFGPGGAEFHLREAGDYGISGRPISFAELRGTVAEKSDIVLGVRTGVAANRQTALSPEPDRTWNLSATDQIVVLAIQHRNEEA